MQPPPLDQVALSHEDAGHIKVLGICSYPKEENRNLAKTPQMK
jgi:hypothetical protein